VSIQLRSEDQPEVSQLLFGKKRVNGRVVEDKIELAALNKMKALRAKCYSYLKIAQVMNDLGIKPKSGGKWHLKVVYGILNR